MEKIEILKSVFMYTVDPALKIEDLNEFAFKCQKKDGEPFLVLFADEEGEYSRDRVYEMNNTDPAHALMFSSVLSFVSISSFMGGLFQEDKMKSLMGCDYLNMCKE